jgi:hypothetical protein
VVLNSGTDSLICNLFSFENNEASTIECACGRKQNLECSLNRTITAKENWNVTVKFQGSDKIEKNLEIQPPNGKAAG